MSAPSLCFCDLSQERRAAKSDSKFVHTFLKVVKSEIALVSHLFLLSLNALELSNYFLKLDLTHCRGDFDYALVCSLYAGCLPYLREQSRVKLGLVCL